MSRTLNKVMLLGNVGRDPDINVTTNGTRVATLRMATTETWKDRDGNQHEHTDWHTIVAWRGLADVVERLVRRGSRIFIEGKLQTRTYEDKEGNKRYVTEVVADNVLLLESKRHDPEGESTESHTNSDDIPF